VAEDENMQLVEGPMATRAKLAWTVAALLSMTALAAPGVSAQTLEIRDEATANHCAAVTVSGTDVDGGCLGHAASESIEIRKHVFGVESHISTCQLEFWGRLNEDGGGYGFEASFTGGAGCIRQACGSNPEGTPWAIQGAEVSGVELITANLCIERTSDGLGDESCEIDLPFSQNGSTHQVELGGATEMAGHGIGGFRCEIQGHWVSEAIGTHDGQAAGDLVVTHL
jgi:hypothetical protein